MAAWARWGKEGVGTGVVLGYVKVSFNESLCDRLLGDCCDELKFNFSDFFVWRGCGFESEICEFENSEEIEENERDEIGWGSVWEGEVGEKLENELDWESGVLFWDREWDSGVLCCYECNCDSDCEIWRGGDNGEYDLLLDLLCSVCGGHKEKPDPCPCPWPVSPNPSALQLAKGECMLEKW